MRFRTRGYENIYSQTYINGVPFNDQLRGVFNFSSIGAINDFTRNGDAINYSQPGQFAFGSIGGGENIRMRAGDYGHGGKATLTYTNRNYWMRAMMSYHTGLSDKDGPSRHSLADATPTKESSTVPSIATSHTPSCLKNVGATPTA